MALSFRAASGGNQGSTTAASQAITLPTGTTTGDLVYIVISIGVNGVTNAAAAGWTLTTTDLGATPIASCIVGYRTILAGDTGPTVTWTGSGKVAWDAITLSPGTVGTVARHSGFATALVGTTTATSRTPNSYAAGGASGASVILNAHRASGNGSTAVTTTPPSTTPYTEPTNGDQSTAVGTTAALRQVATEVSYRLAQTGTITPSAETVSLTSYSVVQHAFAIEYTPVGPQLVAAPSVTNSSVTNTGDTVALSPFTPAVGDLLVAKFATSAVAYPTAVVDNQGNTWTQRVTSTPANAAESPTDIWTATAGTAASTTVTGTFSSNASGHVVYAVVERYSSAALTGTPATNHLYTQAALSSTITTTAANSVVTWVSTDWNVVAGSPTYLSGAIETAAPYKPGAVGAYTAYQEAATAASQTYGFSAPAGQWPSLTALEIRDSSTVAAASPVGAAFVFTQAAVTRAATY